MRLDQLASVLFLPACGIMATAITYLNWRRRKTGTELRDVCSLAGLAVGMVCQAALQMAEKTSGWDLGGNTVMWVFTFVVVTPAIVGLLVGPVLERRLKRRQAPQTEQDYID